jgi:hypothetical protein
VGNWSLTRPAIGVPGGCSYAGLAPYTFPIKPPRTKAQFCIYNKFEVMASFVLSSTA